MHALNLLNTSVTPSNGHRYKVPGTTSPESTRTEKVKQSESTSSSSRSAVGEKRNRADQQGSDASESEESDSPPPRKKKYHGAEKSRKHGHRKIPHEVIDLDNVENLASADSLERANQVIKVLDSDSEGDKREKGKRCREKKRTDNQVTSHA